MLRLVLAAALAALCGCASVPAGAGGVLWSSSDGISAEPLAEGQHFIGLFSSVHLYDLRAQEHDEDLVGLSEDGAPLEAGASVVTLHLAPLELPALDREVGPDYYSTVISPLVRAMARRVLAHYRVVDLDTAGIRRAQDQLRGLLAPALRPLHIILDGVVFRRVLPTSKLAYGAVLATSQAEQDSIEARANVEAARQRAEQRREEARGIAQGFEVVSPTLTRESLEDARLRAWQRLVTSPSTSVLVRPSGETPLLLEMPP